MSGYTADTVEAETMINVYREAIQRGLSLLRNQEVKEADSQQSNKAKSNETAKSKAGSDTNSKEETD